MLHKLQGVPERGMLRIDCPLCSNSFCHLAIGSSGRLVAKCLGCRESLTILKALSLPSRVLFGEEKETFERLFGDRRCEDCESETLGMDDLNLWYGEWLDQCRLDVYSISTLYERGFDRSALSRCRYGAWKGRLDARSFPRRGLPGVHDGVVSLDSLRYFGVIVPVRDVEGRVVSLKLRLHQPDQQGKMRVFSSSHVGGAKPIHATHVPVGVARRARETRRLLIVEGEMKADLVYALSNEPVVGVPGAYCSPSILDVVLDALEPEEIQLAFDNDDAGKRATERYAQTLAIRSRIAYTAFGDFKGPDDALKAGSRLERCQMPYGGSE
jgi:hypothetical protein